MLNYSMLPIMWQAALAFIVRMCDTSEHCVQHRMTCTQFARTKVMATKERSAFGPDLAKREHSSNKRHMHDEQAIVNRVSPVPVLVIRQICSMYMARHAIGTQDGTWRQVGQLCVDLTTCSMRQSPELRPCDMQRMPSAVTIVHSQIALSVAAAPAHKLRSAPLWPRLCRSLEQPYAKREVRFCSREEKLKNVLHRSCMLLPAQCMILVQRPATQHVCRRTGLLQRRPTSFFGLNEINFNPVCWTRHMQHTHIAVDCGSASAVIAHRSRTRRPSSCLAAAFHVHRCATRLPIKFIPIMSTRRADITRDCVIGIRQSSCAATIV
ncbi:hypothetical protein JKP88DRAFT_250090 [Tribonema minus]|uniref:Secreted protein n=1 Tax=Tribonema minus TaxID=303371 RepID=A0A835YI10_9STRA|nr:hypothetical protein JKP88DRAFT_250090 [Tribonema minus]